MAYRLSVNSEYPPSEGDTQITEEEFQQWEHAQKEKDLETKEVIEDPKSDGTPRHLLEVQGPVAYKDSPAPFLGVLGLRR